MIISTILNIITIILWIIIGKKYFHYKQKNSEIEKQNRELQQEYISFTKIRDEIEQEIAQNKKQLDQSNEYLQGIKETTREAFEHYCDALEKDYVEKEDDYQDCIERLEMAYAAAQQKQMIELEQIKKDLEKIKNTRAAAIEALRKEKEISAQKDFYGLKISDQDLSDVRTLERIKKELHTPRILSMLIWKTYFLTAANQMITDVLGGTTVTGVYKITNQTDGCCYIGQSLNIGERWKEHIKAGLGIDASASNKLYKAMQQDGVWNFTFELIEKCSRDQLDEKERFYIELYQADKTGYNSTRGNGK